MGKKKLGDLKKFNAEVVWGDGQRDDFHRTWAKKKKNGIRFYVVREHTVQTNWIEFLTKIDVPLEQPLISILILPT